MKIQSEKICQNKHDDYNLVFQNCMILVVSEFYDLKLEQKINYRDEIDFINVKKKPIEHFSNYKI